MTPSDPQRTDLVEPPNNRRPSRRLYGFGDRVPPLKTLGRVLTCQQCRVSVDVLEAAAGAGAVNDPRHRYIDPATYVCGDCQFASGGVDLIDDTLGASTPAELPHPDTTPTAGMEALGRARTAQETAKQRGRAA